jgi:serine protease Do
MSKHMPPSPICDGIFRKSWLTLLGCVALLALACLALPRRAAALGDMRERPSAVFLHAFSPVVQGVKESVVQFQLNGKDAALGAVIDTNGLALTKASEVADGELTCKLANGRAASAELVAVDDENDLGLVKISVPGLKPLRWASLPVAVGQWAVTPGIGSTPEAVGIISVPPRKIFPKQAFIGVELDFTAPTAKIAKIMPGLGADKAGLKPGDIFLRVNETPVATREELQAVLRSFREGQTVTLLYRRGDAEIKATAEMMAYRPERWWRGFNRQDRMNRLGSELSRRAEGFQSAIQHDTVLQSWQCGGPLLNLDGRAIGLNIARAGRVASYALPASLVQTLIADLEKQMLLPVRKDEAPQTAH